MLMIRMIVVVIVSNDDDNDDNSDDDDDDCVNVFDCDHESDNDDGDSTEVALSFCETYFIDINCSSKYLISISLIIK